MKTPVILFGLGFSIGKKRATQACSRRIGFGHSVTQGRRYHATVPHLKLRRLRSDEGKAEPQALNQREPRLKQYSERTSLPTRLTLELLP